MTRNEGSTSPEYPESITRFIYKFMIDLIDIKTTCYEARNGSKALLEIEKMGKLTDIILLDIDMPIMNGLEFATQFY